MKKSNLLKILVLTLSVITLISFSACGKDSISDDDYSASDIETSLSGTDDTASDKVTGETEGTELEEDIFESPEDEGSKGGVTATPSNSGTGESSKVTSSKDTNSKDNNSKDNSSKEQVSEESQPEKEESESTSSKTGLEVTEDGTIKLPPIKLN